MKTNKTKICIKCKEKKPISEFCLNNAYKDKLHYSCKKCKRNYDKKIYYRNIKLNEDKDYQKEILHSLIKKCGKCGKVKSVSEFYADRSRNDGYRPRCKKCISKYQREVRKGKK